MHVPENLVRVDINAGVPISSTLYQGFDFEIATARFELADRAIIASKGTCDMCVLIGKLVVRQKIYDSGKFVGGGVQPE